MPVSPIGSNKSQFSMLPHTGAAFTPAQQMQSFDYILCENTHAIYSITSKRVESLSITTKLTLHTIKIVYNYSILSFSFCSIFFFSFSFFVTPELFGKFDLLTLFSVCVNFFFFWFDNIETCMYLATCT